MFSRTYATLRLLSCLAIAAFLGAQTKPGPDTITFVDGENLVGELQSATGLTVTFKSDMGFVVTVPWGKIKELRSGNKFAAIPKELPFKSDADAEKVPQGTLTMTSQNLIVTPAKEGMAAAPQEIAVDKISTLVSQPSFDRAMVKQGFFQGWTGLASAGFGITSATVSNKTYNASINLSRDDPSESWMETRNRTTVTFNSYYSYVTQEYVAPSKISIFTGDLVRDHYLTQRWFAFGGAAFEHNYSQGLNLLQAYGGGIGRAIVKSRRTILDVRAGVGFMRQTYTDSSLNHNFVGSRFAENFSHTFAKGITVYEQGGVRPAWNDMKYFFGGFTLGVNVPVYRRLGLNLSSFESYVNNPPPYFKRNAFQLTVGASYTLK